MGNNSSSVREERKGWWSRRKIYARTRNPRSWEVWGEQKWVTVQVQLWGVPWEKNLSATSNFLRNMNTSSSNEKSQNSCRCLPSFYQVLPKEASRSLRSVLYWYLLALCLSYLVASEVGFVVPTLLLELIRRCYIFNFFFSLQCQCSDVTCGGLTLDTFQLPTQLLSHSLSSVGQCGRK